MLTTKLSANHQNHVMCVPDLGMLFMFLVGMSFIVYGYHYLHDAWWVIYINIIYTGKLLSSLLFSFTPYLGMKIRRGREDPYYYSSGCRNGKHVESQPGYQHQKKFQCSWYFSAVSCSIQWNWCSSIYSKKNHSVPLKICVAMITAKLEGYKGSRIPKCFEQNI